MKKHSAMTSAIILGTSLAAVGNIAFAAGRTADLSIMIQAADTVEPLEQVQYYLTVHNNGPYNAGRVKTNIDLPAAATFVQASSECGLNGTTLSCNLGRIKNNKSHTLSVLMEAPSSDGVMTLSADVNSSRSDSNYLNNLATHNTSVESPQIVEPPVTHEFPITSVVTLDAQSCYGSGIAEFADCPTYALLNGTLTLNMDQSISTGDPGVLGSWSQSDHSSIEMNFTDLDHNPVSTFSGTAVSDSCFEGTVQPYLAATDGAWRGCKQ